MNYLLPKDLDKVRKYLIPCQWGEFIDHEKNRYKVNAKDFPKVRPFCRLIKRQPLRVEPTTYSLDIEL